MNKPFGDTKIGDGSGGGFVYIDSYQEFMDKKQRCKEFRDVLNNKYGKNEHQYQKGGQV